MEPLVGRIGVFAESFRCRRVDLDQLTNTNTLSAHKASDALFYK